LNSLLKIRTLYALGLPNLLRVGVYRLGLKTKLHSVVKLKATVPVGDFFHQQVRLVPVSAIPRSTWQGRDMVYFGQPLERSSEIPDWHANPFKPDSRGNSDKPWWLIPDFDEAVGDIKTVWEASRFDWLLAMAQRAAKGDAAELTRMNNWLQDWARHNRPYLGINWKCGQEASIRVLHLILATQIIGQLDDPAPGLVALIRLHLARIAPTMGYAIGQANNHGTSEAAALFIGGSWLASLGDNDGAKWQSSGRDLLENRADALIENDGMFSQYSVNYHRMMLDTYSLCEAWRRRRGLTEFSDKCLTKLSAATRWLHQMCDVKTGRAPVFGANDGARIIALTDTDYLDFRPSVQLAATLFLGQCAYAEKGLWDQPLIWLDVEPSSVPLQSPQSVTQDSGGMHILRRGNAVAYFRYPRFRFRPSQADALHCDVWIDGENILRDAGTFSYNVSPEDTAYFNGTCSHNTVEFDGRDQMPRLGRFLFGDWLKAEHVEKVTETADAVSAGAAYQDWQNASHKRHLDLETNRLVCIDEVAGFKKNAILRWRLAPGNWKLDGNTLSNGKLTITVQSSVPKCKITLTQGEESLYYLKKTSLPVLEIEIDQAATITTEIHF